MGTSHGGAAVRPDGKVKMNLAVDEALYHDIRTWGYEWGLSAGEVVEALAARGSYVDGLRRAASQARFAERVGQDVGSLSRLLDEMADEAERS